jgi:type II secretory ATPase GspE/PulE/Tfp pilus assembly ATPase PilB-like protein
MASPDVVEFQSVESHNVVAVDDNPDAAVRYFVEEAVSIRASDLFFTSEATGVRVQVRHMSAMRTLQTLSLTDGRRCMNFIKTAAGMDLSERRRPADGRWIFYSPDGARRDLRINTIPTLHGEDFSLRLLGRSQAGGGLNDLGLSRKQLQELQLMLRTPGGLILVTGPTGAGKTTTLYGCLHHLNDGIKKLNTIEDPIECEITGVRQSQVDLAIGLDFPDLLRSVLRQAPDVILIGEIRDAVTAQTAIRAANSGHLVIATMHAPVAVAAVRAMLNYEVHPQFLASCLLGVVTQRLVRVLCPRCRTSVDISASPLTFDEVRSCLRDDEGAAIYGHVGCEACHQSGFIDRTGVFEMLTVNPRIRRLIADGSDDKEIFAEAMRTGMTDFRLAGLLKVAQGTTSLEELFRVIPAEHLGVEEE